MELVEHLKGTIELVRASWLTALGGLEAYPRLVVAGLTAISALALVFAGNLFKFCAKVVWLLGLIIFVSMAVVALVYAVLAWL
ncbi:MAG: hypothetical protein K8F91_22255 [Candidatus Obscuribacterales bacterium]|nr:hypothetical protein [Candidatus Obscuribacterales bacterium]